MAADVSISNHDIDLVKPSLTRSRHVKGQLRSADVCHYSNDCDISVTDLVNKEVSFYILWALVILSSTNQNYIIYIYI